MPTIHHGDCIETMKAMPPESVDAIVCDPPYGLSNTTPAQVADTIAKWAGGDRDHVPTGRGFMGKSWDAFVPPPAVWDECLRVLKPGGHMVVFAGSRTHDLMGLSIRLAGFEIRDSMAWLYGSGFPKSHDVGKAIDRAAGAEREVVGHYESPEGTTGWKGQSSRAVYGKSSLVDGAPRPVTAPSTPEAAQWDGWGTALKPGHEPVVVARKPHAISGILDGIGSELARLEDECRPSVNGAAKSSAPTPAASPEVRTATAPESAATPHEGDQARTTPTGAAAGSSAATDTSVFESEGETCWSTVTSWRACWDELCELTSMSITSTASSLTTDLRTLWSSIASLTATSTPGSPTSALTSPSTASAVDSLFAATVLRLRATLALSAPESATASTPHVPQDAGGSSAFEPIVLARKPLAEKTVARNVLAHGTGAINVDACRIETDDDIAKKYPNGPGGSTFGGGAMALTGQWRQPSGRWPANVLLDHHAAAWVDEQSGPLHTQDPKTRASKSKREGVTRMGTGRSIEYDDREGPSGASRFFYVAKAPKRERPNVGGVQHPTVKPLAVMQWLIRLVTPPGGVVLDPFAGSGTTIEAALIEGFDPVGIEMEADYLPLIQHRIDRQAGTLTA